MRENARIVVLVSVILCLLVLSFLQVSHISGYNNNWSLRYNTPISGQAAQTVRQYAVNNPEYSLWPTFWREDSILLESELTEVSARSIQYSGEGFLVWPAGFVQGGWPGATDESGCVISTNLAWRLWGSYDIVGKEVMIEGKPYYVRGIIDEKSAICLIGTDVAACPDGWQAAEFRSEAGVQRSDIITFMRSGGSGQADIILNGSGLFTLSLVLAFFPAFLLGGLLLIRWVAVISRGRPFVMKIIIVSLMMVFAILLPWFLDLFPSWVIPARWSDFSHWADLSVEFSGFIDSIFRLIPSMRDVMLKKALVTLVALSAFCSPLTIWLGEKCK